MPNCVAIENSCNSVSMLLLWSSQPPQPSRASASASSGAGAESRDGVQAPAPELTRTSIKGMNPNHLKAELKRRNQPTQGTKKQLQTQLLELLSL